MAGGNWGKSKTDKKTLELWWDRLMEKCDYLEEEEVKYFYHCTTLRGMDSIQKEEKLNGGYTGLPARAPLASNEDVKGVWVAMSPKELPSRSPYGTQRVVIKVRSLMTQLSTPRQTDEVESGDRYDAPSDDEDVGKKKGKGKKKDKKKARKPVKKNQKDCYLQHRQPEKQEYATPFLFFECAHFYGSTQYVRLILIRQDADLVDWCRETLKEINIRDNPFLGFKWGRIFTYTVSDRKHDIIVETLVVGDIHLNNMTESPNWDTVGTVSRAGFDPRLGVL